MTAVPQERSEERSWNRRPEPSRRVDAEVPSPREPEPAPALTTRRARRRARRGLVATLSALPWPARGGRRDR